MKIQLFTTYNKKLSNGNSFMNWDGKTFVRQEDSEVWLTKTIIETLLCRKNDEYILGSKQDIKLSYNDLVLLQEAYTEFESDGRLIMPDTIFDNLQPTPKPTQPPKVIAKSKVAASPRKLKK